MQLISADDVIGNPAPRKQGDKEVKRLLFVTLILSFALSGYGPITQPPSNPVAGNSASGQCGSFPDLVTPESFAEFTDCVLMSHFNFRRGESAADYQMYDYDNHFGASVEVPSDGSPYIGFYAYVSSYDLLAVTSEIQQILDHIGVPPSLTEELINALDRDPAGAPYLSDSGPWEGRIYTHNSTRTGGRVTELSVKYLPGYGSAPVA